MKKNSLIRTILINIGIFLGILIVFNFLIVTGWETRRFVNYLKVDVFKKKTERIDPRALLPNYKDVSWAKEYFKDFNRLKDDNYESYIGWRKTAFTSTYINIDSSGDRITPQYSKVTDSVTKILFLGGSTMWGTGSPDDETIPAFFSKGDNSYFVKNFGESGYRAMQSYIYLLLKFNSGEKTDWVITYDGVNDAVGFLDDNNGVSTIAESRMKSKLKQNNKVSSFVTDLTYWNLFLGPIENSITRFKSKNLVKKKMNVYLTEERTDIVAKALLDSWLAMMDLSEKNNTKFLAVLQPNAALGSPNISYLEFNEYERLLMSTYDRLYNRVRELLLENKKYNELQYHVLDLTYSFDGDKKFYIDWCHVTPNGNEVIAKQIMDRIKQNNKIK
jgi:hypothetical protein